MISERKATKQTANAIYDSGNYGDVFERDLFLYLVKARQEAGCEVTVITLDRIYISHLLGQIVWH